MLPSQMPMAEIVFTDIPTTLIPAQTEAMYTTITT